MNSYFTIPELCCSSSYPKLVEIPKEGSLEYNNLLNLINNLLNPVREKLGKPIIVTSGFRNKKLNAAVNGAKNSNHTTGCAADIHTGNDSTDNVSIATALISLEIPFDELICEGAVFNKAGELVSCKWVHVALRQNNNRKKFLYTENFKTYHPLKKTTKISK